MLSTNTLQVIFEKAKQDENFAKELLFSPIEATQSIGITLNEGEKQALMAVSSSVGKYYGEQLYLAAQAAEPRGINWSCLFWCS